MPMQVAWIGDKWLERLERRNAENLWVPPHPVMIDMFGAFTSNDDQPQAVLYFGGIRFRWR